MIAWALRQFLTRRAREVERSLLDPRAAQLAVFDRLVRLLRRTEVGRQSGLDGCKSLDDCRRLAVSDDESMRPLFQRMFEQGSAARSVMGRSRLVGFARTSGTQGNPKDVPMNAAYVASLDRTLASMVASRFYTNGEWDSMLTGRQILLGSRPRSGTSPTGLPICDISGFIPTRTWRSMRWAYIPRHADLWIADWSEKAERILEQARGKNVVSLVGIPALAADFMARAKAKFGVKYLGDVWPNLREYIFGAVHLSAAEKARITREWFGAGHTLRFHETYISTEAPIAFSFDARDDGLALNTLENLYLFRPYSAPDTLLFADELREGQAYSIHVTTPGGLVNFRMGDRVEVTSTKPLLVRLVGRESDELSMTGEKITLAQVDLALEAAGLGPARLGPHMPAVWVELADVPHLVWALPARADGGAIDSGCAAKLDEELCTRNVLYAEARIRENVVGESRVIVLPRSVFALYQGARLGVGQFKPKRLFESRAAFSAAYSLPTPPLSARGEGGSA